MLRRLLLVSASLLSLAACNLAPDYHPPQVATPAAYKEAGPWRPAEPADGAPRGPWWVVFHDGTLDRLEPLLEKDNPGLAAAVARYDQARALAVASGANLYPRIDADGAVTANRESAEKPLRGVGQPNHFRQNQMEVVASYEIDLWGKLRNQAEAGLATAEASGTQLAAIRLSLQAELAADYFALRGLDADARLLSDTVGAYQKALDLTKARFNGAIASGMDVSRAETQLSTARAQVSDIAGRRALLEHAIATLLGQPASSFSIPPEVPDIAVPDLPAGLPSILLQRRPDIAAAERTVRAATAQIGVVKAAFYPSFFLGAQGGFQSTNLSLIGLPNSYWSVGPGVRLPIFEGGRLDAEESQAYARLREVSATYRAIVLGAFQEVEDNLGLIHWLGLEAVDEEAGVNSAQRTLNTALNLYEEGADSYLEVVTAQTALLQAQQASLDLRTRRLAADVGLIRALGGGWSRNDMPSEDEAGSLAPNTTGQGKL